MAPTTCNKKRGGPVAQDNTARKMTQTFLPRRDTSKPKKSPAQAPKHPGRPPAPTLVVRVNRAKWARGPTDKPRYLWSERTKRCDILGFILLAAGLSKAELDKKSNLRSLPEAAQEKLPKCLQARREIEPGLGLLLTMLNDADVFSEKNREQELEDRCSWYGIKLVFEGKD